MADRTPTQPISLMQELQRRKVLYVAVVYGVSAFAVTEIASFLFENFGAPQWAERLLAALFVAGFPVAMFLAWAFDIGTDGIVRSASGDTRNRWGKIGLALCLLVIATGGLFYLIFPAPQVPLPGPGASPSNFGFEPAEKLENSVAVLPFDSLSADADDAFFSRGVAEEILNHLGSYGELNIIGRTSSFVFGGGELPAPRISALLGARYLLQGSVRRAGKQVRVSTQLLDENGVQVWSRNFDRQLEDIFDIQTQIAVAVAAEVVSLVRPRVLDATPTRIDAYELYLKGRDLVYGRNRIEEARDILKRAIELDPQYAPAYAELAVALAIGPPADFEAAGNAVDTALELRPGLLRALAARGLILGGQHPPDLVASETVLRQVLAKEPSMIDASLWLSNNLDQQGHHDQAEEVALHALRLDPLHPTLSRNVFSMLVARGEDQRAEAIMRRVIESPQNASWHPYAALFFMYRDRGRLAEAALMARRWTQDSVRSDMLDTTCYCLLMSVHASLGDEAGADYWLARSKVDFPDSLYQEIFNTELLQTRGRFDDALKLWSGFLLERFGQTDQIPWPFLSSVGNLEGLAGHYEKARATLEPLLGTQELDGDDGIDSRQTLAWAYGNTGRREPAAAILDQLEKEFAAAQEGGTLMFRSGMPYGHALNAALLDREDEALDRLEAIIEAGWNAYYDHHHDPRWGSLRDHPRFRSLMAKAQAGADRQRAELESSAPSQAFIESLDAIFAAQGRSTE